MKRQALLEPAVFFSCGVIAEVRDQSRNDDDERYDPPNDLSEVDLIDPALKADSKINREDGFLDWRLNHFWPPFREKKGDKKMKTEGPVRTMDRLT